MVKRNKGIGSVINDTTIIASKLPWWGALFFGTLSFLILYFVIPSWLENNLNESNVGHLKPMLDMFFNKHINKFEWAGIACGLIGLYFTFRNYIIYPEAEVTENSLITILAKLLSRKID